MTLIYLLLFVFVLGAFSGLFATNQLYKQGYFNLKQYRFYIVLCWVIILAVLSILNYICELKNGF